MRGVSACPSRLELYLLLQKSLKTSGKPALVSSCRNLPDCLAAGGVWRKLVSGTIRDCAG